MSNILRNIFAGLIGLAGFISVPALAADWVRLSGNDDEMDVYYDRNSIAGNGRTQKVWMKYIVKQAQPGNIRESIDRVEFLCPARQMRTLSSTYYQDDGNVGQSHNTPDAPFIDIIPDSVGDILLAAVCSKPSPKPGTKPVLPKRRR